MEITVSEQRFIVAGRDVGLTDEALQACRDLVHNVTVTNQRVVKSGTSQ